MIWIDRGIGRLDVAQNRIVIAKDKIREVRPDLSTLSPNAMAFRTGKLVTEEESFAMQPIATGELGNVSFCVARQTVCLRGCPRHQDATQRQRPPAWVFGRVPAKLEVWGGVAGFENDFNWEPVVLRGLVRQLLCKFEIGLCRDRAFGGFQFEW